jgi:uncharacterized protein
MGAGGNMFEIVEFQSVQNRLRGRIYRHESGDAPWLVMTHGTSATITMVADAYAETIHRSGFNILLYDHANFGISSGEPRQEINPWVQARGYRDAVQYLRSEYSHIKVALWGDSYSAMIVLVAAAMIPDIEAVVAQIPACGIELPGMEPSDELFLNMQKIYKDGDVSGGPGNTLGPLPVVSLDQINAPSILVPPQAYRWFLEYGGRHGSHWENRATRVVPPTEVPFSAYLAAPFIQSPVLMMVGRNDEMVHCNRSVQTAVFDKIKAPKDFYEVDGGHFGLLWHPGELFDEAVNFQIDFLKRHVPIG